MREIETDTIYEVADFFKIMGDVTRIRLLISLEEKEKCVGELAQNLKMTKSAVSHQLKILRNAKLAKAQKRGKNVFYSLNDYHIKTLLDVACGHICE